MAEQNEKSSYKQQIYNQMKLKDTEELLTIWKENDREEWTDEAFEQIRLILKERLGDVPEPGEDDEGQEMLEEEIERRYLGITRAFKLAYWLKVGSWVAVAYVALQVLIRLYYFQEQINSTNASGLILQLFVEIFSILVNVGFIYLLLLTFSEILYLLEDIHWLMMPKNAEDELA